jgi:hypothetical protein
LRLWMSSLRSSVIICAQGHHLSLMMIIGDAVPALVLIIPHSEPALAPDGCPLRA